MKRYIEFPLEDGTTILVEVDEPEDGIVKASRGGEIVAKAQQTFENAMEKVKPAASAIINKLRGLSDAPDEVEVQFGLKMSAEAGAIVAAVGMEANYTVTLKWKKEETISSKSKKK
jgi:NTP-dependent ternary system trypsin peptidase co-occuring protein